MFPPTLWKSLLATTLQYSMYAMLAYMIAGPKVLTSLGVQEPAWLATLTSNRLYLMVGYFLLNSVVSSLSSSGAYEVYLNDELLYSKLKLGAAPSVEQVEALLVSRGITPGGVSLNDL